jgi:hypothetical protein
MDRGKRHECLASAAFRNDCQLKRKVTAIETIKWPEVGQNTFKVDSVSAAGYLLWRHLFQYFLGCVRAADSSPCRASAGTLEARSKSRFDIRDLSRSGK